MNYHLLDHPLLLPSSAFPPLPHPAFPDLLSITPTSKQAAFHFLFTFLIGYSLVIRHLVGRVTVLPDGT